MFTGKKSSEETKEPELTITIRKDEVSSEGRSHSLRVSSFSIPEVYCLLCSLLFLLLKLGTYNICLKYLFNSQIVRLPKGVISDNSTWGSRENPTR